MTVSFPPAPNPLPASNTFAFVGDSRLAAQFIDASLVAYPANAARMKSNTFFFNWANALLGQRMKTVYNGAISGYRSDQYLVNLPAALASGAKWLCIWGVTNDIVQSGTTGDTALTMWMRVKTAALQALGQGMNVLLLSEPGENGIGGNAAMTGMVFQFNEYLREFCDVTPGAYLFDVAAFYLDPAQSNLTLRSAWTSDGIHPNAYGAYEIGVQFADLIGALVPPVPSQIYSSAEVPANGNVQQLLNPLFLTATGGTSGTGITGNTPAGYLCGANGGATATLSTAADSSGYGNAVTLAGSFTASGDNIYFQQGTTFTNFTVPGDVIDMGAEVSIASGATNLGEVVLFSSIGPGLTAPTDLLSAAGGVAIPGVAMDLTLRSVPLTFAGTEQWVVWGIQIAGSGAGSFSVTIRRPWLRRRVAK